MPGTGGRAVAGFRLDGGASLRGIPPMPERAMSGFLPSARCWRAHAFGMASGHRAAHGKRQGQVFIPDSGGAQRGQAVGSFPYAPSSVAFRHSIRICTGQGLWMGFRPVGDCPQMAWMSLWKSCSHPARGQAVRCLWRFDHLMSNGISERIRPVGYRPQFPWTVLCPSCG